MKDKATASGPFSDIAEPLGICAACSKRGTFLQVDIGRELMYCPHNRTGAIRMCVDGLSPQWQMFTPISKEDFVLAMRFACGGATAHPADVGVQ